MRNWGKTEPVERVTEDQVSMCTLPSPLFGGWIFCSDERPGVPLSLHSGLQSAAPFRRSCLFEVRARPLQVKAGLDHTRLAEVGDDLQAFVSLTQSS